jgi:hypothetical protein
MAYFLFQPNFSFEIEFVYTTMAAIACQGRSRIGLFVFRLVLAALRSAALFGRRHPSWRTPTTFPASKGYPFEHENCLPDRFVLLAKFA